jgi:hypothetical protein
MKVGALLSESERRQSVDSIESLQIADGLILWTPGGHSDPWNHVESAMALDVDARFGASRHAYEWMKSNQRPDGSWHQYYVASGVEDEKFDANTIAYVAVGVQHHWLATSDDLWLGEQWDMITRALTFVLELQQPTGEIFWAREPDGTMFHYALVTGSSSIHHSLGAAIEIGSRLGHNVDWLLEARSRLGHALRHHQREFFAEKDRWAMDWYYPVLGGIHVGEAAVERLRGGWSRFVMAEGVRCVDDHPWVTTGETAEAAIACAIAGMGEQAADLMLCTRELRADDGSYWTGLHVPSRTWFPEDERTSYSAAAVVLADAVSRRDRGYTRRKTRKLSQLRSRTSAKRPPARAGR